jgi:hypothetical protein
MLKSWMNPKMPIDLNHVVNYKRAIAKQQTRNALAEVILKDPSSAEDLVFASAAQQDGDRTTFDLAQAKGDQRWRVTLTKEEILEE